MACFCCEFLVFLISILVIGFVHLLNKNPPSILHIYQRPNGFYWFKFAFAYTLLSIKKVIHKLKKSEVLETYHNTIDRPQPLSRHKLAIDAVYFNGSNKDGDFLVTGTARRQNHLVDGFFYLLVNESGLGVLESPHLPFTSLTQTDEEYNAIDRYSAEGILIEPIEAMRTWRVSYEGKMKQKNKSTNGFKLVDVYLNVVWSSDLPFFNFETDMNTLVTAKSMANEKWSRKYFETLKLAHQTHYEQHGTAKGEAKIDGKTYSIKLEMARDHSFGLYRDWRNLHRYIMHFGASENGDRFNVGVISVPISFSSILVGYIYVAKDKCIHAVESCDLQLYQHGEFGTPPIQYAFTFRAGGRDYTLQVERVLHEPHFYISKKCESKVIERMCLFRLNGTSAWGTAEWQYRNIDGINVAE